MKRISFYFQLVTRIVSRHFSGCYSTCYSFRRPLYARSSIQWIVPVAPEQPRKLIWLVDSLVRLKRFPPMVRKKLGFALYQSPNWSET